MSSAAPIPPPPEGPSVHGAPRSGVYTNTSAAAQILLFKHRSEGKPTRYKTVKMVPGEVIELDAADAAMLEKTAAFRTQAIKRGRQGMPAVRALALSRADETLALKFVAEETRVVTLREWLRSELRPAIREAIAIRIKSLPGQK